MAKTNYSKVEEALNEGLLKLTMKNLLDLADVASGKSEQSPAKIAEARKTITNVLKFELKHLIKHDPGIYNKLEINKEEIHQLIDHVERITNSEWEIVAKAREKVDLYRAEQRKAQTPEINEKLIDEQRQKHINKRFNINDKWLPLK